VISKDLRIVGHSRLYISRGRAIYRDGLAYYENTLKVIGVLGEYLERYMHVYNSRKYLSPFCLVGEYSHILFAYLGNMQISIHLYFLQLHGKNIGIFSILTSRIKKHILLMTGRDISVF